MQRRADSSFPGQSWARHAAWLASAAGVLTVTHSASAQECVAKAPEECEVSSDCFSQTATECIEGTCQVPCEVIDKDEFRTPSPRACGLGQSCVPGEDDAGLERYFCQDALFSMDLNLLDSCIYYFINGLVPDLPSDDASCSLVNRLNGLLNRDQNPYSSGFDVYDVDACVKDFLEQVPCKNGACADGQAYCDDDDACGEGLFCNTELYRCERECGFITSHENSLVETLERTCAGRMQICDYDRGRCVDADVESATCELDRDCPSGAYCFLGQCQAECYRSHDCPDSSWTCSEQHRCVPRSVPGQASTAFDPAQHSVLFAQSGLALDLQNPVADVPLLILNNTTREQVVDNPAAIFGYRVQVAYDLKQTERCFGDLKKLTPAQQRDCLIEPEEEFIELEQPFGTLGASVNLTLRIRLDRVALEKLSPGTYTANLRVNFSNGKSTMLAIRVKRQSPSGEYRGQLSLYLDHPENHLGNSDLSMRLFVAENEELVWDNLLRTNNLPRSQEYVDLNRGLRVEGTLHGNDALIFSAPGAKKREDNEIRVKGIYSPSQGRMRLIAVMDLPTNACWSDAGECKKAGGLDMANPFGRALRRVIELVGPYDAVRQKFEGMYRETISGLAPFDVTVSGGFVIEQVKQNDDPIAVGAPLLLANAPLVSFPAEATINSQLDAAALQYCTAAERDAFSSAASFDQYMEYSAGEGHPIRADLTRLTPRLEQALASLKNPSKANLTLADFFRGQQLFCKPPEVTTNCVDFAAVQCGMALYRKALVSGWVALTDAPEEWRALLGRSTGEDLSPPPPIPLLCPESSPDHCKQIARDAPTVATLEEHGRFYHEAIQTYSFKAGEALSDAFYVLYRLADGLPQGLQSAFQYKEGRLRDALAAYDAARELGFGPAGASTLFAAPMDAFEAHGRSMVDELHVLGQDRMEALKELADVRRRVLRREGQTDFVFTHHVIQQEYLVQVFLAALQREWEGDAFAYAGQSAQILAKGQELLAATDDTRNPLGLHANRVFFENSDTTRENWQNFRKRVDVRLPRAKEAVARAISEMQAVLNDKNDLINSLTLEQQQVEEGLTTLCGDDKPLPSSCDVPRPKREFGIPCSGEGCSGAWVCEGQGGSCERAVQTFAQEVDDSDREACRADRRTFKVSHHGEERLCVRGRMGTLLQERALLDLQREHIFRRVATTMHQIARQQKLLVETQTVNRALEKYLDDQNIALTTMEATIRVAEDAFALASTASEGADCLVIAGLAFGTNCAGKAVATGIKVSALGVKNAIVSALTVASSSMQRAKELTLQRGSDTKEELNLRAALDNMVIDAENLISEYEAVVQQLFNLDVQIADTHFEAKELVARGEERQENLLNHLTGSARGSVLTRNRFVETANDEFHLLMLDVYKMAQALVHRYNLGEYQDVLLRKVYEAQTVRDVEDFLANVELFEQRYCTQAGIDCDAFNNRQVLRFSLREQLFPDLRDIVDPETGSVLTKGEQFHRMITSAPYLERLVDGTASEIEIPFALWLNDRGVATATGKRFLVDRNECNHVLAGEGKSGGSTGTIAVHVLGQNIGTFDGDDSTLNARPIRYKITRGDTDYMRSCNKRYPRTGELMLNTYVVGRDTTSFAGLPLSASTARVADAFSTISNLTAACVNASEVSRCYALFARDRSVGAPDWKLIVPNLDDEQSWLLSSEKNAERVISDIVLFFRYNARPADAQ